MIVELVCVCIYMSRAACMLAVLGRASTSFGMGHVTVRLLFGGWFALLVGVYFL